MRVVKETSEVMVLKEGVVVAFIIGVVLFVAGLVVLIKPSLFTTPPPFWAGLIGIAVGVIIILAAKATTITIDRTAGRLAFLRKGLLGGSAQEYELQRVKEVELSASFESHISHSSSGGSQRENSINYKLAFVLDSGETVPFSSGTKSNVRVMGIQTIPGQALGKRVAAFLGVPFQERRPPTLTDAISTITSVISGRMGGEGQGQA